MGDSRGTRWRDGRPRRAVSPIIGIILLVAITVVLAAVLYELVAQEAHGSASVPLGSEFAAGPVHSGTVGSAATNAFCATKHYCYAIPIVEAGGGLTLGDLTFRVAEATGSTHIVSKNYAQISIVTQQNKVVAFTKVAKNAAFAVSDWKTFAAGTSANSPLSDQQTIWLQFGNTAQSPFGQGDQVQIFGTGSFSGSVTVALP
jgi:flagellin-like protein